MVQNAETSSISYATKVKRNPNFAKLQAGYLFAEVGRRRAAHIAKNPDVKVINLGPGDTTEPIPCIIAEGMKNKAQALSTVEGYSGYGAEQGEGPLRAAIQKFYLKISPRTGVKANEIFVSDGAKCDVGRLQMMFGSDVTIAVQDTSFPVYVDSSVIMGQTGLYQADSQQYRKIHYMKCAPENDFFPDLTSTPRTDIIFFCSPNNPTGAAATRKQMEDLVEFAKKNGSIIVLDAAYSMYITDDSRPKSIYEIPGAREVAIEISSFSKVAGFTGVRLGWTVVPEELMYADSGSPLSEPFPVIKDFSRLVTTSFNGASNIAQAGGLACFSDDGWKVSKQRQHFGPHSLKLRVISLPLRYLPEVSFSLVLRAQSGCLSGIRSSLVPLPWLRSRCLNSNTPKGRWRIGQILLDHAKASAVVSKAVSSLGGCQKEVCSPSDDVCSPTW